jgi:chromosome segregation ATPase
MNLKEQEDLLAKVEKAKEQIARLRKQQEDLEREKAALEDLGQRQEEWHRGRKELSDVLVKSLAVLESEEAALARRAALVRDTREGFARTVEELTAIREDRWTQATLKEELNRALVLLHRGRTELSEARARIRALDGRPAHDAAEGGAETAAVAPSALRPLGAGELVRIGFWLLLPAAVMATAIAVFLVFL